ncbi:MAG: 4-amino-4-deoxychorismate lyase [Chlorobi bacterium]|nr:4-amino-4-deoxychorismate lyase [Chlorobiota bacterium]
MKLLETIKFENGHFANLDLHSERMNNARKQLFEAEGKIDLSSALSHLGSSAAFSNPVYKCRILYGLQIEKLEMLPYTFPTIESLRIISCDQVEYGFKYADRHELDKLFARRKNCDDILIVKDNLITDSSFCNVLFYNGKKWLTPEKPLLKGVQRQYLLDNELVETANISVYDLHNFEKLRLVNAMISFEAAADIAVDSVF